MNHFYFPLIMLIATFLLTSCFHSQPITTEAPENNNSYQVDFLFEYDGCKIYRFWDRGNYVYFTNCKSDITAVINDSTIIRNSNRLIPVTVQ